MWLTSPILPAECPLFSAHILYIYFVLPCVRPRLQECGFPHLFYLSSVHCFLHTSCIYILYCLVRGPDYKSVASLTYFTYPLTHAPLCLPLFLAQFLVNKYHAHFCFFCEHKTKFGFNVPDVCFVLPSVRPNYWTRLSRCGFSHRSNCPL